MAFLDWILAPTQPGRPRVGVVPYQALPHLQFFSCIIFSWAKPMILHETLGTKPFPLRGVVSIPISILVCISTSPLCAGLSFSSLSPPSQLEWPPFASPASLRLAWWERGCMGSPGLTPRPSHRTDRSSRSARPQTGRGGVRHPRWSWCIQWREEALWSAWHKERYDNSQRRKQK